MVSVRFILSIAAVASVAAAGSVDSDLQLFERLLKRQAPGSPAYNCHDNCGQAIIQARGSASYCTDNIFLTDYKNCLQCAGPDNFNIWTMYGRTLTTAASACGGLSTTPLSGKQPDVGAALPASSSGSSASAAATSAAAATSGAPATSSAAGSSTSGSAASAVPTTSSTRATSLPSSSAAASITASPSRTTGASGTVSGAMPSSTSSRVVVPNAGIALNANVMGLYGAVAVGAMYAVAL